MEDVFLGQGTRTLPLATDPAWPMLLLWLWGFYPDCCGQHCVSGHRHGGCPCLSLCHCDSMSSPQGPNPVLKTQPWAGALLTLVGFPHCSLHPSLLYWQGPSTDYLTSLGTLRILSDFVSRQHILLPGWPTTYTTPSRCGFHPLHLRLWFQLSLSQNISLIPRYHDWNTGSAFLECFA